MPCCLTARQTLVPSGGPRGGSVRASEPSVGEEVGSLTKEQSHKLGLGEVEDERLGKYPTEKTSSRQHNP